MDLGLNNRVAIVTGGSEGIGKATATRLSLEGAKVAICGRRRDVLEAAATEIHSVSEGEILPIVADISKAEDIRNLILGVVAKWGKVDILVNNAGIASGGPFEENTDEAWFLDLELKLFGAIRCIREVLPFMKQGNWGRVINVTNLGGKAPGSGSTPTSVSRAGGIALTKALSKEFASDNILVNTVCIGRIKASQGQRSFEVARSTDANLTLDQFYKNQAQMSNIPLGRIGEASEAADVIAFLASERASYVTGVAVNIDGGASPVV
jgi:NAD(P)-dependent dehydrogenase (short-subunit alcohol dehydrogenase family)